MPSLAVRSTTGAASLLLTAAMLSACEAGSADPDAGPATPGGSPSRGPTPHAGHAPAVQS